MVDFKIYGAMDPLPWVTSINPLKAGKRSGFAGHDQHVANPSSASHRQPVHLASHQVELLEAHDPHHIGSGCILPATKLSCLKLMRTTPHHKKHRMI